MHLAANPMKNSFSRLTKKWRRHFYAVYNILYIRILNAPCQIVHANKNINSTSQYVRMKSNSIDIKYRLP